MSGVKGRSGRKAWSIEEKIHHLRDTSVKVTTQFLEDRKQPIAERAKISAQHSVREIGNKTEITEINKEENQFSLERLSRLRQADKQ